MNFDHIRELKQYFETKGFHPKKHFGQNFLTDKNFIDLIVKTAEITSSDILFEVGPGGGILTRALIATNANVISIEIDNQLVSMANDLIGQHSNWELIHGDVMHKKSQLNPVIFDAFAKHPESSIKCIANLPYSITTPFIINSITSLSQLSQITVLIQLEIAEKFISNVCSKEYGILSVVSQVWGKVELSRKVPHQAFWPQPKVESAIINVKKNPDIPFESLKPFAEFVKQSFLHRRKKLTQSLKSNYIAESILEAYEKIGLKETVRPEEISPSQWFALFNDLSLNKKLD